VRVFRLAAARYAQSRRQAFGGAGGVYASARWHTAGRPIVYTAQSLSLAALEILVHLKQTRHVQPFRAFAVEVPDALIHEALALPPRWHVRLEVSRAVGDAWLAERRSPALLVPSAVTPGERNVLLNPAHPEFSFEWVVTGPVPYRFDARLLPGGRRG
jgi:RES domain-containing protein